jgi:predicted nucleotidyltransferase component of viral defense system
MEADKSFYFDQLYPLQDRVLRVIGNCETEFYLTGGTALSRGYLNHRFSDDLDLFVNYASARAIDLRFALWCDQITVALAAESAWQTAVVMRQDYFARIIITSDDVALKLELVNDVPSHIGDVWVHPVLGRLDSAINIFVNKITALRDRDAPRDLADVWALIRRFGFSIEEAIVGEKTKAAGTYHPQLAQRLCKATRADWEAVRWIDPPDPDQFIADLVKLGESLILP